MNVSLSNSTEQECVRDTSVTAMLFPCLYSALFLVALVLNCLAAWVFFNIRSTSTFVVYLKNVVVADLLMTLTIAVKVLSDAGVGSWQLRAFYCRYSAVLFYSTMYISILLLGLISLDRYLKIVRPFGKSALQRVEVLFWGTLLEMLVCYSFISRKVYQSYKASRSSSKAGGRHTKVKVFVVVGVFFLCFAPFHFTRVPYTLTQTRNLGNPCRAQNALYVAKETTLWLSATNVCLDPLIYVFLCRAFRRKLTAALGRRLRPQDGAESSRATSTQIEMSQVAPGNKMLETVQSQKPEEP